MEIGTKEYILLKVLVQKNKLNYISLEGECYNQSNAVYENGSCRETYEPFTDDDPQNGVAEALAELEYKNELLSLSILGSNVMINVVMQNDKINKMPKTYKGILMSGSELEKRMDIATFDATKKYKEGTMVKFKSLDGEYILGEAGKSAPCAGGVSAFKAYDKSSYKGHNSVIDGLENMGRESKATLTSTFYALGGGISKFSTFTRDASLEFGEKVLGLNYDQCAVDSKSNKKLREMYAEDDKRDAEDYDKLREKAPNKDVFDNVSKVTSGGLILTDIVLAGHGLINIAKSGISLAKLSGKAQNILKFGDKIANKSKNTVNKIGELNRLKNTKGVSNPNFSKSKILKMNSFQEDILSILKNEKITLDEFNSMRMKGASELTDEQRRIMMKIREQVPIPNSDTTLQKVIDGGKIDNYVQDDNSWNTVGGFITKAQDTKELSTLQEVFDGLALGYEKTPFTVGVDKDYGIIRFKTDAMDKIDIPYGPTMERVGAKPPTDGFDTSPDPFTGHGFTKDINGNIIPEYTMQYLKPNEGAELYRVNSETGIEELIAKYVDGKFVKIK